MQKPHELAFLWKSSRSLRWLDRRDAAKYQSKSSCNKRKLKKLNYPFYTWISEASDTLITEGDQPKHKESVIHNLKI